MNDVVETRIDANLQAAQPLPLWLTILLVVSIFAFVAWIYATERGRASRRRRGLLAALRLTVMLCVLWMFCGYSWIRFTSDRPELVIAIDRSASMRTQDVAREAGTMGRFERVMELLEDVPARLRTAIDQRYQTRWFAVADDVESIAVDWSQIDALPKQIAPDGQQSRLGDALRSLVERQAGGGTAAIVLFTDGINTNGSSLASAVKSARMAAIPIYTVAVGRPSALPDLRLADLLLDREVYLGDQVVIELSVIASDVPDATARLSLRQAGSNSVLDETRVVFREQENQQHVRLSFVPQRPGEIELELHIEPLENEQELENNTLLTTINVQDKTIKVLMVFESPSYEFRFLKSLLERTTQQGDREASSFELSSVLQEADVEYVQQDASALRLVPSSEQTLWEYDAFVFGEFNPRLLSRSSQQSIYDAVTVRGAGCAFVFSDARAAQRLEGWPLAGLLPIQNVGETGGLAEVLQSFHWEPTQIGKAALPMQLAESIEQSQKIWQQLPAIQSVMRIGEVKPGDQVLANAVNDGSGSLTPLLVTQFAGAGRSALLATDETYMWTSVAGSDLYHQRFWGQLLRWLSRGKLLGDQAAELLVDPKQARHGQPVHFQWTPATTQEPLPTAELVIEGTSGRRTPLLLKQLPASPRIYSAAIADLPPDRYRAMVLQAEAGETLSVDFIVSAPPSEQANLRADLDSLRGVADVSRGQFYLEQNAAQLFEELPPGRAMRLGSLPPKPIWNSPWVALLLISLLTAEWMLRRSSRML